MTLQPEQIPRPSPVALAATCVATLCLLGFAHLVAAQNASLPAGSARIEVLSSRPALVTGSDALVHVAIASPIPPHLRVVANGADVTSRFRPDTTRSGLTALLTNLRTGANQIEVSADGVHPVSARVVAYPLTGPVISGPHEQPFVCETDSFRLQGGGTLGAALDTNCSVATRVDYVYRSTSHDRWTPLPNPSATPADAVRLTTSTGATVPYVVRIETGTVNRAIYQIALLHDPSIEPGPDFATKPAGWNGRLIYTFGGGCAGGWYRQGASTGGVVDDVMLRQGYAVASASLNVFGNNCNDLLAAETMMMVKERFIEAFGPPRFTIGWGCSGGSYQAHQIGDNYPGLLDGIVIGCSFPDVGYTSISAHSFGARLMYHYFQSATEPWTRDEQVAASGLPNYDSLQVQGTRPDRIRPRDVCDDSIPHELLYDPVRNPRGARCTVYDHTVNVYGRDPSTGFARRFLDNVGVQYGLRALTDSKITKAQFLELNEKIGGIDADANFIPSRTSADLIALRIAYESGRILWGGGGLAAMPIIDYRGYADYAKGDPHMRFYSFSTRERLIRANGHADNQVMLIENGATYGLFSTRSPQVREALRQMDAWLSNLEGDTSAVPRGQKVVRAKPSDLVDACFDGTGAKIVEKQRYDGASRCNELYPSHGSPYLAAGMPIANNVVKCQLNPVDPGDYKQPFTAADLGRLRRIFPNGVCDYTKPGVEQRPLKSTWLSFGPSSTNPTSAP